MYNANFITLSLCLYLPLCLSPSLSVSVSLVLSLLTLSMTFHGWYDPNINLYSLIAHFVSAKLKSHRCEMHELKPFHTWNPNSTWVLELGTIQCLETKSDFPLSSFAKGILLNFSSNKISKGLWSCTCYATTYAPREINLRPAKHERITLSTFFIQIQYAGIVNFVFACRSLF